MKKISVIIPVYNHEKYLPTFLKSLDDQDYSSLLLEYIAVDDGSKDASLKILKEYEKTHSNFKVLHQENKGITGAKKTGLNDAQGDYLAVLESDDYISSNYFSSLVKQMEQTNTNICNPRYAVQVESSIPFVSNTKFYSAKKPINGFNLLENKEILLSVNVTHIKLYKRNFLNFTDKYFVFNEDLCMTYINAAKAKTISFSNDAIYHYIQRKTGLVSTELSGYGIRKINNFIFPLEEVKNNFEKENLLDTYSEEVEAIFIKNFMEHLTDVILRTKKSPERYDMISILTSILTQYYPNWRENKYYKEFFKGIELTDFIRTKIFNLYDSLIGTDNVNKAVPELLKDYADISKRYEKKMEQKKTH